MLLLSRMRVRLRGRCVASTLSGSSLHATRQLSSQSGAAVTAAAAAAAQDRAVYVWAGQRAAAWAKAKVLAVPQPKQLGLDAAAEVQRTREAVQESKERAGKSVGGSWWQRATGGVRRGESAMPQCLDALLQSVPGLRQIAVGEEHCLALDGDGQLYAWGSGQGGRLGMGEDVAGVAVPVQITGPGSECPDEVLRDGQVRFVQVACGALHSAAVDTEGRLWTWGANGDTTEAGMLGHGVAGPQVFHSPTVVEHLLEYGAQIAEVACGSRHTVMRTTDGEVLACGAGEFGRLGNGTALADALVPETVQYFEDLQANVTQVAAGPDFSLALTSEGHVYGWGRDDQGQVCSGNIALDMNSQSEYPTRIGEHQFLAGVLSTYHEDDGGEQNGAADGSEGEKQPVRITQIAAGSTHGAAIDEFGRVYSWGMKHFTEPECMKWPKGTVELHNEDEQEQEQQRTPRAVHVQCGNKATNVIDADGRMYSMGHPKHIWRHPSTEDDYVSWELAPTACSAEAALDPSYTEVVQNVWGAYNSWFALVERRSAP